MKTELDAMLEELESPSNRLMCAGQPTSSSCFTLHEVRCHKTEDFLDGDECRLTVSVDGVRVKTLKKAMKDGQRWQISRGFSYEKNVVVKLWDEDWPDSDDLIGTLSLSKDSTSGTATKNLRGHGAHYSIRYSVKHPPKRKPKKPSTGKIDRCMTDRPAWVHWDRSPNHKSRGGKTIDRIIYHATGGSELKHAINTFRSPGRTSAHYVIARDGQIVQMVELIRAAQHSGKFYNQRSVGIEIVNKRPLSKSKRVDMCELQKKEGKRWVCTKWTSVQPVNARDDYYRHSKFWDKNEWWIPYSEAQYQSLIKLTNFLITCIPTVQFITGHEHLVSWRNGKFKNRNDPGGAFDWPRIEKALAGKFNGHICRHYSRKTRKGSIDPRWIDACPGFRS